MIASFNFCGSIMLGLCVSPIFLRSLVVTRGLLQLHSAYLHLREEEGRRDKGGWKKGKLKGFDKLFRKFKCLPRSYRPEFFSLSHNLGSHNLTEPIV